ncbi:MAG: SdpI family protein [Deinococcales bacterium]
MKKVLSHLGKYLGQKEGLNYLALGVMLAASLYAWPKLSAPLPVHWNIDGESDRYGSKAMALLLLPFLTLGIYLLIYYLPQIDPRAKTQDPKVLRTLRLVMSLGFMVMHLGIVSSYLGSAWPVERFVMLAIGLIFLVIGNLLPKVRENWFIGIRTPWTLDSDYSWFHTHRLGGLIMVVLGLVMMTGTFFLTSRLMFGLLMLGVGLTLLLIPYSYWLWRKDPGRRLEPKS